jgi:hypothetical protein
LCVVFALQVAIFSIFYYLHQNSLKMWFFELSNRNNKINK